MHIATYANITFGMKAGTALVTAIRIATMMHTITGASV